MGHSKSPQLFERYSGERGYVYGKDVEYLRNEIKNTEELEAFVRELKQGAWAGCNVTMPWKTEMVKFMDDVSDTARITDAVNTVSSKRGRLFGDSTDGRGMLNAVKEVSGKERISSLVILGCGGAARSIIAEAVLKKTGKLTIVCRGVSDEPVKEGSNLDLTLRMLDRIKTGNTEIVFIDSSDTEGVETALDEAEVLINSTPLGMIDGNGNEDKLPLHGSIVFRKSLIVADCVYNPDETLLIKKAYDAGCRVVKGIRMLEEQAKCGLDVLL